MSHRAGPCETFAKLPFFKGLHERFTEGRQTMELDVPVVGILRGVESSFFHEIMETSFVNGLQAIEVTMNTEQAEQIIARNRDSVPEGRLLGMGTIRNLEEAKRAEDAGAMFFVTPNLDVEVVEYARAKSIPTIIGALTPTEVYKAWSAGADMVKVFPCRALGGPRYIKDLLGPFERIPLVAVGGVNASNLKEYFEAGSKAVGVSESLFGREALKDKNLEALAGNVKNFIERCLDCTGKL
jgi:2-dehydro-3-deoxyphosphogluconate aldolase/(4S)-4-hydroxy-2-oxoglutarate aldolase